MSQPSQLQDRFALAAAHWNAGRQPQAEAIYKKILAAQPKNAEALEGLGLVAMWRGRTPVAQGLFERALKIEPGRLTARASLADILKDTGRLDEAQALAERVLAARPDNARVQYLMGEIAWKRGDVATAFQIFAGPCHKSPELAGHLETMVFHRLDDCDWRGYDIQKAFLQARLRAGRDVLQALLPMLMSDSPADIAQGARTCAARRYPAQPPLWTGQKWRHPRIRIGFLTAEIYDHPVGQLLGGTLEHFDRNTFELFCFSYGPDIQDAVRDRIVPCFDEFLQVTGKTDDAIATMVFEREIDIAVTLNGYTVNARPGILARRPAPVQVNYQGYPGGMGAPYIDYMVADRQVISEADKTFYTENIVWMPDTYQPTDDSALIGATPTRGGAGLPDGAFVFMAYHQACKISPPMFAAWMRILARVEGAVLWLGQGAPAVRENLRREATACGIDPDRLVFAGRVDPRADHLARHRLGDLFLDTLPFNAHSTASDALWAGLPVMTCRGTTFPGRVCAGLLTAAGLPDLIAEDLPAYEDMAVLLAQDPDRLAAIRRRVQTDVHKSALFDTARYTRHLESAFRTMHETSQAGLPPRSFAVDSSDSMTPPRPSPAIAGAEE